MKTGAIRARLFLAFVSLSIMLLSAGCANTVKVKGDSMAPTIRDSEVLTTEPDAFRVAEPQRGDIVVFEYNGVKRISRIIGLPGETITLVDDMVHVNGQKLDEPYLPSSTRTKSDIKEFRVTGSSYFMLGDNRGKSNDSRAIGAIPRDQIVAKVIP